MANRYISDKNYDSALLLAFADMLANMSDWDSNDVRAEVSNLMAASFENVDPIFVQNVLDSFSAITPKIRLSPRFNHIEFVRKHLPDC